MKQVLLLSSLVFFSTGFSQVLNFNNIEATVGTNGLFLHNEPAINAGYQVPKGSGNHAIFASALWCSAEDPNGQLYVAATRFNENGQDFFSGPYSSTNAYQDPAYLAAYGFPIWEIAKSEIQTHLANYGQSGYVPAPSIANWPANGVSGVGVAQNLAPFVDMNNNGVYEPLLGDYPDIRGDKAVYFIMNDSKGIHTETGGLTLGIEIHAMFYQFATTDYLNNTTFMHFRVFNRGAITYPNFRLGLFSDFDLGNSTDDYMGCDSTLNLMYVYNGDNTDEASAAGAGYGNNPPAAGIMSLNQHMKHFAVFTNGATFPYTDPSTAVQYDNFMNGTWADGSAWSYGGNGSNGSVPANYLYPGNPNDTTDWTEVSASSPPGDRRGVIVLEDEYLLAGAYTCYDFAVLYSREVTNNNTLNVNSLSALAGMAKTDFDAMNFNCDQVTLSAEELDLSQIGLYPNPTSGEFTVSFGNQLLSGEIVVTDMRGRLVLSEKIQNENLKILNISAKSGMYNVEVKTFNQTIHKKIVVTE